MESKEEIIKKYGAALCALYSYKSVGFFSREYSILRSQEILSEAIKQYNEAPREEQLKMHNKVKASKLLTYRELFEKMFLCIEDLAAIIHGVLKGLESFHIEIVKSPSVKKTLSGLTDEKIFRMLRYRDIGDYEPQEQEYVKSIREPMIDQLKHIIALILEFYELNEKAYNRMKHGNSLFYTLDTFTINNEETFVIPVQYNTKEIEKVDVLVLNETIYTKTWKLFNYIQSLLRIICDMNIDFIQGGGEYHPLGLVIEPKNEAESEMNSKLIEKYSKTKDIYNISTNVSIISREEKIQNIVKFYNKIPL
jgi:hypothetical protein